jgi:hypothetical protein
VFPLAQPEATLAGKIYGDLERLGRPIGRADRGQTMAGAILLGIMGSIASAFVLVVVSPWTRSWGSTSA